MTDTHQADTLHRHLPAIIIILLFPPFLAAQNLVINPGFEELISCPTSTGQLELAAPWSSASSSPDYFNRCAVFPAGDPFPQSAEVPDNFYGNQEPFRGDAYAGYAAPNEFITGALHDTLVADSCYYVEFYVNLAEFTSTATGCDVFGIYFSAEPVTNVSAPGIVPQFVVADVVTNADDWSLISGTFTATGGERFFTLGGFDGCESEISYYFVDEFKVMMLTNEPENIYLCTGGDDCYVLDGIEYCTPGTFPVTLGGDVDDACERTFTLNIIDGPPPVSIVEPPIFNCSDGTYTLAADFEDFAPDLTFEWRGPAGFTSSEREPVVSEPGRYYFDLSTSTCTATDSTDLVFDLSQTIDFAITVDTLTCTDESVTLTPMSSVSDLSFEWTGPGISSMDSEITVTESGEYTVVLRAPGFCDRSETITVADFRDFSASIDLPTGNHLCDVTFGFVILSAVSEEEEVEYLWSTGETAANIAAASPGDYSVTATSSISGCTSADTVTVFDQPEVTVIKSNDLGCGLMASTLTASASLSGMTFAWSGPDGFSATGPTISTSEPGTYTVTATNPSGSCTGTDDVVITEDTDGLTVSAGKSGDLDCASTIVELTATSPSVDVTFSWVGPAGFSATGSSINATEPGPYTVTAADASGSCMGTDNVVVTEDTDGFTVTAGKSSDLDCATSTVELTATSPSTDVTFTWSGPDGFSVTGSPISVSEPGTYTVTAANISGSCMATDDVVVTEDTDGPTVTAGKSGDLDCATSTVELTATSSSADVTFSWSGPDGFSTTGSPISAAEPGTYTVTATNSSGSCMGMDDVVVTEDTDGLTVTAGKSGDLDCISTTVELTATSTGTDVTFNWSGPDGFSTTGSPISVAEPGTYTLTAANNTGTCSSTADVVVEESSDVPDFSVEVSDTLGCLISSVDLTASAVVAGVSYTWVGPEGFTAAGEVISVLTPGLYTASATNARGCTDTREIEVIQLENPSAEVAITQPSCLEESGSISIVNVMGGVPPYQFTIDGGDTFTADSVFVGLAPGLYDIIALDTSGCEFIAETVDLSAADSLVISLPDTVFLADEGGRLIMPTINFPDSDISTVLWSGAAEFSCTDCLTPRVSATDLATLMVTIILNNGCQAVDSLVVIPAPAEALIYFPTAFSPSNGDGLNDRFLPFGEVTSTAVVTRFDIYDRWGGLVYSNANFGLNDRSSGWDGTVNGRSVNTGVYVYVAEIMTEEGEVEVFTGSFSLF